MRRDAHNYASRPIEGLLGRAAARTRALDVGRGAVIVINFVLLVLLVLILYDHTLKLPVVLRIIGNIAVTYATGVLALVLVILPALRRLSRRYLALEIERTQKGFHHTLVSYMEARDDPAVPDEIVRALGQRASEDAQTVVLDKAIDEGPFLRASAVLIGVLLAFFAFWMLTDKPVHVSVRRILHPFGDIPAPSRVRLVEISPGDAEVTRGTPLRISVRTGKVIPESAHVRTSTSSREWSVLPLEADDESPRNWSGVIASVDKDFFYRVTAGDAESRIFRVQSFPAPIIEQLALAYNYPPYTGMETRRSGEGDIVAPEGTRVDMEVFCSNVLARAWLAISGKDTPLALTKRDERLAVGAVTVTEDGTYSIHVRDTRGARNDPVSYRIVAQPDRAPAVAIENQSEEVSVVRELSTVELVVAASDDYGIVELSFYYRVNGGVSAVRRHDGGRGERSVRVTEALDLAELLSGRGDTVSFFAEARDAHTPEANYAKTPVYVIAYAPSRVEGKLAARDAKAPLRDRAVEETAQEEQKTETEDSSAGEDGESEREREELAAEDGDGAAQEEDADEAATAEDAETARKIAEALERLSDRTAADDEEPVLVADASDQQAREATGQERASGKGEEAEAGDSGASGDAGEGAPSSSQDETHAGDSTGEGEGGQQESAAGDTAQGDSTQDATEAGGAQDSGAQDSAAQDETHAGDSAGESERGQQESAAADTAQSKDAQEQEGRGGGSGDAGPSGAGQAGESPGESSAGQGSSSSDSDAASDSAGSEDGSSQGDSSSGSSGASASEGSPSQGSSGSSGSSGDSGEGGSSSEGGEGQSSGAEGGSSSGHGSSGSSGSQGAPSQGASSTSSKGQGGDSDSGGSHAGSGSASSGSSSSDGAQGGSGTGSGSGAGATGVGAAQGDPGSAGGTVPEDQAAPDIARPAEGSGEGELPFVEKIAAQLHQALERGEVDEEFLEEVTMTREELLEFAKKYEKIFRPRRDTDSAGDQDASDLPERPASQEDASEDVVMGSGVDEDARGLRSVDGEALTEEELRDLFDEFSDNVSPEYRDVIEAYYKNLARDRSE